MSRPFCTENIIRVQRNTRGIVFIMSTILMRNKLTINFFRFFFCRYSTDIQIQYDIQDNSKVNIHFFINSRTLTNSIINYLKK